jgi:hypothetical protein
MKQNTVNLMLLLVAVVIIMAIVSQHYDNVEFSLAALGLNVKASRENSTTLVNMPMILNELASKV